MNPVRREQTFKRLTSGELVDALELCRDRLRKTNMDVVQTHDLDTIMRDMDGVKKTYLTKQLDPRSNDFHSDNAFWLKITEGIDLRQSGARETLGMAGARMDLVPPGEFPRYFSNQMFRLYSAHQQDQVLDEQEFPPEFYAMGGRVVYLGDFFMRTDKRGVSFDKTAFTMCLYLFAMLEWRFDWLYLFIRQSHAAKGYFSHYNMPISYPASILWKNGPPERSDTDNIGILNKDALGWMVRRLLIRSDLL